MSQTVAHCLALAAHAPWGGAVAATMGTRSVTFAEIRAQAMGLAETLVARGIGHGAIVAVQAPWSLDQLALFIAVQEIGAVFAPLNPAFSEAETATALAYLDPALVVTAEETAVISAARQVALTTDLQGAGKAAKPTEPRAPSPDDLHAIFLTSGSTGQPKGVMLSHRAAWLRTHMGASRFATSGGRGELVSFPMFHWAGWNYLLENWAHRRAVHFPASRAGADLAETLATHRPAFIYCIPALWERLLASDVPFDPTAIRSVATGTSRFAPELMARLSARFPHAYRSVLYGSTEFGAAMGLGQDLIDAHPGAIGLPHPGVEARLEGGELLLRGPTVMDGYYNLPQATAEVLEDGWYRTGDLAEMDETGVFTLTGRAREVIRSGGETIAPAEVELALAGCPGIGGVAVVGLPDPKWGEVVCAAITPAADIAPPDLLGLRQHLETRLAAYKHPRKIVLVDDLPVTAATGQIQRSRIRTEVIALSRRVDMAAEG